MSKIPDDPFQTIPPEFLGLAALRGSFRTTGILTMLAANVGFWQPVLSPATVICAGSATLFAAMSGIEYFILKRTTEAHLTKAEQTSFRRSLWKSTQSALTEGVFGSIAGGAGLFCIRATDHVSRLTFPDTPTFADYAIPALSATLFFFSGYGSVKSYQNGQDDTRNTDRLFLRAQLRHTTRKIIPALER
jgi:hypothetical protein